MNFVSLSSCLYPMGLPELWFLLKPMFGANVLFRKLMRFYLDGNPFYEREGHGKASFKKVECDERKYDFS